jgi:hypothetical protein
VSALTSPGAFPGRADLTKKLQVIADAKDLDENIILDLNANGEVRNHPQTRDGYNPPRDG